MKKLVFLLTLFFLVSSLKSQESCTDLINDDELYENVLYFADPELDGRQSGSKGYLLAAQWVAKNFAEYGLKDLGYENYFQELELEYNEISNCSLQYSDGNTTYDYKLGEDFVCRGFSGSGNLNAEIVFCGYGIETESYNDYESIDVKGKVAVVFKRNPDWKIDKKGWGELSLRKKLEIAVKNGAIGVVFLSNPNDKNPQKPIGSLMHGKGKQYENIPQIQISNETAHEWFSKSSLNFKELQSSIDKSHKPSSQKLIGKVSINVDAKYTEKKKAMNIVGLIEGSDSKLKNEYIVIGAHLDHVGRQSEDMYFPGANDNASGVSSVMAIAKTFAECQNKPKRSIIFVAFAAEESGLEGSKFFIQNCPVNTKNIIAMLNLDCVAHGDSIVAGCGKSYPKLHDIVRIKDSEINKMIAARTWKGGGADAQAFHEAEIPTAYFVATNTYTHLHLPSDEPRTLNIDLHVQITKLVYNVVSELAKGNYKKEKAKK